MRDGTLLRADVYRPVGVSERPLPALVSRTPYNKESMGEVCRTMAARGYIAIVQDIRGRYASDGEWRPMYDGTNLEPTDGYDTVEWAARLPGCTGDVGTFGGSYVALTQWRLAPTRPPQLRAMYTSGFPRFAYDRWPGIFRTDRHLQWHITTTVPDYRRRQGLPGPTTVDEGAGTLGAARATQVDLVPALRRDSGGGARRSAPAIPLVSPQACRGLERNRACPPRDRGTGLPSDRLVRPADRCH